MKNSLKINAIANSIKTIFALIFPLITFPYISRILGVENYGIYQFCNSVVTYFMYFASLGIATYAIRLGSGIKDSKEKIERISNQLFSINVCSSAISLIVLLVLVTLVPAFKCYNIIILILSFSIVLNTLGCEWLFSIYEDYTYISLRTVIIQLMSIVLMFAFVKTKNDLIVYSIIALFASSGSNLLNIFSIKKYVKLKFTLDMGLKEHIKPIVILFFNNISIVIYVNSDLMLLGLINGNVFVGLYGVASRIYSIVKQLLNSITIVAIPRLSNLYFNNKISEFKKISSNVFSTIFLFLLPGCVGLFMLSNEIIELIAGNEYLDATPALELLAFSLFFSGIASFYSSAILIPTNKEKIVLKSTLIAACINVIGNLILLPYINFIGAALTTLISEITVFVILYKNVKDLKPKLDIKVKKASLSESFFIMLIVILNKFLIKNSILVIIFSIVLSGIIYFIINCFFHTFIIEEVLKKFRIMLHIGDDNQTNIK